MTNIGDILYVAEIWAAAGLAGFSAGYIKEEIADYKRRMNELSRRIAIKGDGAVKEIKDYYNYDTFLEKALGLGDTLATRKFLKDRNAL